MDRLAEEWASGANRFEREGEALFAGYAGDMLSGVGGLTHDPMALGSLRMRRFYVRRVFRRHGVGRAIATTLIASASLAVRKSITVNAGDKDAAAFWQALGFVQVSADTHTHAIVPHPVLS